MRQGTFKNLMKFVPVHVYLFVHNFQGPLIDWYPSLKERLWKALKDFDSF